MVWYFIAFTLFLDAVLCGLKLAVPGGAGSPTDPCHPNPTQTPVPRTRGGGGGCGRDGVGYSGGGEGSPSQPPTVSLLRYLLGFLQKQEPPPEVCTHPLAPSPSPQGRPTMA